MAPAKLLFRELFYGILSKDSGQVLWNGENISRKIVRYGYLPEERGLYSKATVNEQLMYFATLKGMSLKDARNTIENWCDKLNISEYLNRPAEQLSKGNQQKVQLLTSLLHSPELLILDEPFSGLDPVNTRIIKDALSELVENGTYIVLSAHQMSIIEEFCEDILILDRGITILTGNLTEIKNTYGKSNILIHANSEIEPFLDENIEIIGKNDTRYLLKSLSGENISNNLLKQLLNNNIVIDKFEVSHPSLEDIFIEKVGNKKGAQL